MRGKGEEMARASNLGERISGLEATVEGMDKYAHQKWHDLNNILMPLAALPERITRDIAKMHGTFDGRLNAVAKEIERGITAAVEKGLEPVKAELTDLKSRVDELEDARHQQTGAKNLALWLLKSPLIAWLVAAAVVFAESWRGGK